MNPDPFTSYVVIHIDPPLHPGSSPLDWIMPSTSRLVSIINLRTPPPEDCRKTNAFSILYTRCNYVNALCLKDHYFT